MVCLWYDMVYTNQNQHQVIEEHYENKGINNVPVVFVNWYYVDEGPDYEESSLFEYLFNW